VHFIDVGASGSSSAAHIYNVFCEQVMYMKVGLFAYDTGFRAFTCRLMCQLLLLCSRDVRTSVVGIIHSSCVLLLARKRVQNSVGSGHQTRQI
jgi:hypothetical protein